MQKNNPVPQGKYVPATRFGNLIYTAGMTPRKNGVLIMSGKVTADADVESFRAAMCQAADNALTAAQNKLEEGEKILQILQLMVYINAEDGYTQHAKIADLAVDFLNDTLGSAGVAARTSVGVASLPGNAPFEVQMVAAVEKE